MYENLIYLSVLLSVWSLKLNAQDIDFPFTVGNREVRKSCTYPKASQCLRYASGRLQNSNPTTRLPVLNQTNYVGCNQCRCSYRRTWITLDEVQERRRVERVSFIDNLAFAGVGRDLSKGDTLPEHIHMSEFKYPLKPNKYQVHFYVFSNIYTYCNLTDMGIQPVKGTEMQGALV